MQDRELVERGRASERVVEQLGAPERFVERRHRLVAATARACRGADRHQRPVDEQRLVDPVHECPRLCAERVGRPGIADRPLDGAADKERRREAQRIDAGARLGLEVVGERLGFRDLASEDERVPLKREEAPALGRDTVGSGKERADFRECPLGMPGQIRFDFTRAARRFALARRRQGERRERERKYRKHGARAAASPCTPRRDPHQ